jgi:hypothetical protein
MPAYLLTAGAASGTVGLTGVDVGCLTSCIGLLNAAKDARALVEQARSRAGLSEAEALKLAGDEVNEARQPR